MSLYFVAIEPQPDLSTEIRSVTHDFAERFASSKAFRSFPHITVIPPFKFDEANESEVTGKFLKFELKTRKFNVRLNGFACFEHPKHPVIFIKPEPSPSLSELYESTVKAMHFNYVENFHPHLTVAYRDLSFENFQKAWNEYADRDFERTMQVKDLNLYKHFDGRWNVISSRELL